jgi:hypothetical protein
MTFQDLGYFLCLCDIWSRCNVTSNFQDIVIFWPLWHLFCCRGRPFFHKLWHFDLLRNCARCDIWSTVTFCLNMTIDPQRACRSVAMTMSWAASGDHESILCGAFASQEGVVHVKVMVLHSFSLHLVNWIRGNLCYIGMKCHSRTKCTSRTNKLKFHRSRMYCHRDTKYDRGTKC